MDKRSFGRMGENAAALWLTQHGCTVLHHNLYIGHDEIDLVAEDETHIIFAEVKTRHAYPGHSDRYGSPSSAVDAKKSACLIRAAQGYMASHSGTVKIPRIDVVEIYADPMSEEFRVLDVVWMKNAVKKTPKFGRKSRYSNDSD